MAPAPSAIKKPGTAPNRVGHDISDVKSHSIKRARFADFDIVPGSPLLESSSGAYQGSGYHSFNPGPPARLSRVGTIAGQGPPIPAAPTTVRANTVVDDYPRSRPYIIRERVLDRDGSLSPRPQYRQYPREWERERYEPVKLRDRSRDRGEISTRRANDDDTRPDRTDRRESITIPRSPSPPRKVREGRVRVNDRDDLTRRYRDEDREEIIIRRNEWDRRSRDDGRDGVIVQRDEWARRPRDQDRQEIIIRYHEPDRRCRDDEKG